MSHARLVTAMPSPCLGQEATGSVSGESLSALDVILLYMGGSGKDFSCQKSSYLSTEMF